jgi:hypothetical protein
LSAIDEIRTLQLRLIWRSGLAPIEERVHLTARKHRCRRQSSHAACPLAVENNDIGVSQASNGVREVFGVVDGPLKMQSAFCAFNDQPED